jgi:hypothetical protein
MTFPTPLQVGVHVFSEGDLDAHRNTTPVFTPALDEDGELHAVIGWQPASTSEPVGQFEERVVTDVDLLVPPGFPANERDVIDLPYGPAGQFRVIGVQRDYNNGPYGFSCGEVLRLKKVDG